MQMEGSGGPATQLVNWSIGHLPAVITFTCMCFGLGMAVKSFAKYAKISAEVPVILLFIGLVGGILALTSEEKMKPYIDMVESKPAEFLPVVLPVVIFGIAYHLDIRAFFRNISQILIIVLVGNTIFIAVVGTILKYFAGGLPWVSSLTIAAACACTAPLPVISLLNDLGRSKGLVALLQGEWLGNIVISLFALQVLEAPIKDLKLIGFSGCSSAFGQLFLGPVSGFILGALTAAILPSVFGDVAAAMLLTLGSAYGTFYFAEEVCGSSGSLAVMILGLAVSYKRPAMEPYDDLALLQFWKMLSLLVETSVYLIVGGLCVLRAPVTLDLVDFARVLLLYIACFGARLCALTATLPVLSRVGYGLTWPEFTILNWGSNRGTNSMLIAMLTAQKVTNAPGVTISLVHMTGLVLFTVLANGLTLPLLLQLVGFVGPSPMRRIDLQATHCDLNIVRKRKIRDMQADMALPDAAWPVVQEMAEVNESIVVYPATPQYSQPSCLQWLKDSRSESARKEAVLRLLRLKKVAYWRQYACGMLSTRALRLLLGAVGVAADRYQSELLLKEIKSSWGTGRILPALRRRFVLLIAILRPTVVAPHPRHWRRARAFSLAISSLLARAMLLVLLLNFCTVMWQILRSSCPKYMGVYWTMQSIDMFLYLCLVAEFVIKVIAFGFRQMFRGPLNIILVVVLITATAGKTIDLLDMTTVVSLCVVKGNNLSFYLLYMCIEILRLVLLARLLLESVPFLLTMLDHVLDSRLIFGFEVASSFVAVQQEVLRILPVLRTSKTLKRDLRLKEQRDRFTVLRDLGVLQSERPTLGTQVQSGQALRCVLSTQSACVRGLTDRGLLDYSARDRILSYIVKRQRNCRGRLKELGPRSPLDVLLHLPWLEGDTFSYARVLEQMKPATFQFGEVVLSVGTPADGMYVVLSGMVHLEYRPTDEVKKALVERGQLPAMDYFGALNFEDRLEDFVLPGKMVGEVAALTGRPHDAAAVAESAVQAFWLPQTLIDSLLKSHESVRHSMWLSVGSRVAQELLGQLPSYDKCGSKLSKARVEILSESRRSVTFGDAEDAVLVQGVAMDVVRGVTLKAPALVPRTTRYVELPVRDDETSDLGRVDSDDVMEAVLLAVPLRSLDVDNLNANECRDVTWHMLPPDPLT